MRLGSAEENLVLTSLSGAFVSARKIPFPGNRDWVRRDSVSIWNYWAERPASGVALRPFSGQVGEAGNAHAVLSVDGGKASIHATIGVSIT